MKMTEKIMGMNVIVEVLDDPKAHDIDEILNFLHLIDSKFSTYKKNSEISKINARTLKQNDASPIVKKILELCEETRILSNGYFNIVVEGFIDPSGLVKGYAIWEASKMLSKLGYKNFYISVGTDLDIRGSKNGMPWKLELPNPLANRNSRALQVSNCGVATSGNFEGGILVYNPLKKKIVGDIVSLTVVALNAYEADRYSTAAFAMGEKGIPFLEKIDDVEGLMITRGGKELMTSQFHKYLL